MYLPYLHLNDSRLMRDFSAMYCHVCVVTQSNSSQQLNYSDSRFSFSGTQASLKWSFSFRKGSASRARSFSFPITYHLVTVMAFTCPRHTTTQAEYKRGKGKTPSCTQCSPYTTSPYTSLLFFYRTRGHRKWFVDILGF